ncbi:MAG TPA: hypothetical protein VJ962_09810 [Clostridia bacterium]|nr:hypothetical protein [Clostridia bacterium]
MKIEEIKKVNIYDEKNNIINKGDIVVYVRSNKNIIARFDGLVNGLLHFKNLVNDEKRRIRQSSIDELYIFESVESFKQEGAND